MRAIKKSVQQYLSNGSFSTKSSSAEIGRHEPVICYSILISPINTTNNVGCEIFDLIPDKSYYLLQSVIFKTRKLETVILTYCIKLSF